MLLFNFTSYKIKQNAMSTVEFNQMLLANTDYLRPFAFTLTRDNESAKDLLQETIYRALANREKYNVHHHA
jgi:DNA-directed RNA polymerase specialized sigma24 family protein